MIYIKRTFAKSAVIIRLQAAEMSAQRRGRRQARPAAAEPDDEGDEIALFNAVRLAQQAVAPEDQPHASFQSNLEDFKRQIRRTPVRRMPASGPGPIRPTARSSRAFRMSVAAGEGASAPAHLANAVAIAAESEQAAQPVDDGDSSDDDAVGDDAVDAAVAVAAAGAPPAQAENKQRAHAALAHVRVLVLRKIDRLVFTIHQPDVAEQCADACFHLARLVNKRFKGKKLNTALDKVVVNLVALEPVGPSPTIRRLDSNRVVHVGGVENPHARAYCPEDSHDRKAWERECQIPMRMYDRARVLVPSHSLLVRDTIEPEHEMWQQQPYLALLSVFTGLVTSAVLEKPEKAFEFAVEIHAYLKQLFVY